MPRLLVVGGGIIGTALALLAAERGHTVVQFDRSVEPRGASVRNFGLIWILGRATGRELKLALSGREWWRTLAERAPRLQFRACGALIVAQDPAEVRVLEAFATAGCATARGARLIDAGEARAIEPALRGPLLGALYGSLDAQVEPAAVLPALRALAESTGRYQFHAGLGVRYIDAERESVIDVTGVAHTFETALVCTGHQLDLVNSGATRKVQVRTLQMMETDPLSVPLGVSILDGGSLRYYPAFDLPERSALPMQDPVAREFAAQLLVTPRAGGALTVGDTHRDDDPDGFALDERAYAYLAERFTSVFGAALPAVRRRWIGQYARPSDAGSDVYLCEDLTENVRLVTAVGGMGMTAGPAIAAEVLDRIGL
jgi:FAD dependent oxidoreductase TIGR03364